MTGSKPSVCPTTGCHQRGDPFCYEHTRPHAEKVARELRQQEEEIAKVREGKWRAIDVNGSMAQEFMRVVRLAERPPTVEKLNSLTVKNRKVTEGYLRKLKASNLLTTVASSRGQFLVLEVKRDS